MGAISRVNLRLAGSHAGISIGEDGPSQMALEDIAAIRAIHSSVVLHPCDANQTAKLVAEMADTQGIVFLRTLRPNTPVIYDADEEFFVGGSRVVRASDDDDVTLIGAGITVHEALKAADALADDGISARVTVIYTSDEEFEIGGSRTVREGDDVAIVGAGITVHEALKAAEMLAQEGIEARVIDLYSIKPIDTETLRAAAEATGRIVTVEDHFPDGGLGDAVLAALAETGEQARVVKLAVTDMPHSGKPDELLNAFGIDAEHIEEAARQLVREPIAAS
jgi:transketolase